MTQPINGTTTFNNYTDPTTFLNNGSTTSLTATNVDGWDFTLLSSTLQALEIDAESLHSLTGQTGQTDTTVLITGVTYTNNPLGSFDVRADNGALFTLHSVDVTMAGSSPSASGTIELVGYRNGSAVTGALLSQTVSDAVYGTSPVTFNVSGNANFANIDEFVVEASGTLQVSDAFGIDNINATFPPVVTTDSGSAAFTAGNNTTSTPVTVDSGVTVIDTSSSTLTSATVSITGNFHSGEDVLAFSNTNSSTYGNISAFYSSSTGVLTLASAGLTASLSQWQAALEAVTYTDTAVTPNNATRTISFSVTDAINNTSSTVTRGVTVTDTDQSPIVTTDSGSAAFIAGNNTIAAAVVIDSGITVSDSDNTHQASGTVSISGNFHSAEDVLAFTNTTPTLYGNISASYNSGTGVLTLTSSAASATDAQWANALSAVTYRDTAVTPNTATRTISFVVNDGTSNSAAATRGVTVTDVDQSPIVTTDSGSAAFVAGNNTSSTPVAIDSGLTVTDADNSTEASATVTITSNLHTSEDALAFINTSSTTYGNITASYSSGTGVLTLTSSGQTATLAQWQAALRAVTYTDTAVTPNTAIRTISFVINDGTNNSTAATRGVTVTDTDQSPIVATDSGSAAFTSANNTTSTPVAIDSGLTVTDLDNTTEASGTVSITGNFHSGEDVLAFSNTNTTTYGNIAASYNSTSGVLTLTSSAASATLAQWQAALRAVTYTDTAAVPNNATRTISFIVNDGISNSSAATRGVTVTDTDQSPVVTTDSGSVAFVAPNNTIPTGVVVDSGIGLTDADNTTEASATVSITGNFVAGQDVLAWINAGSSEGNIAGSYNGTTGVLTLTSAGATATLSQWRVALANVNYINTAITPNTATRTISFVVNDGTNSSTAATRTVTVADTDQTPIVTTSSGSAAFVEANDVASTPVAVDPGVTVTKRDNTPLTLAPVVISGNFQSGQDVLGFVNNGTSEGNIAGSYNSSTGVLTLTSAGHTATIAQWQAALRAVTYTDTAAIPNTSPRTISFGITDGTNGATVVTRTVTVTATYQSPVVTPGTPTPVPVTAAATPVTIDPSITVTDVSSSTLASATVAITSNFHPHEDTLTFNGPIAVGGYQATTGLVTYGNIGTGNIVGSFNASTGVLTLSSSGNTATVAQFQSALRDVTFTDTAEAPTAGTRTIGFSVSDGIATSTVATETVTVGAITPASVSVYRFFDSANGTQFLTADATEASAITNPNSSVYQPAVISETNGFGAISATASDPNEIAVYRFFDTATGAHFFTASASERDAIMNSASSDYNASYVYEPNATFYEDATAQSGDVAVYRLFNSSNGTHFYTSDTTELAGITTPGTASYLPNMVSEGIAFYAPTGAAPT